MNSLRSAVGVVSAAIGIVAILYIGRQCVMYGRISYMMSDVLASELAAFKAPSTVALVRQTVTWEPGWARASGYYKSNLRHVDIEDNYRRELVHLNWSAGPMLHTRPLNDVDLVYHKGDREFRLTFAGPQTGITYEVTLLWVHSSQ